MDSKAPVIWVVVILAALLAAYFIGQKTGGASARLQELATQVEDAEARVAEALLQADSLAQRAAVDSLLLDSALRAGVAIEARLAAARREAKNLRHELEISRALYAGRTLGERRRDFADRIQPPR